MSGCQQSTWSVIKTLSPVCASWWLAGPAERGPTVTRAPPAATGNPCAHPTVTGTQQTQIPPKFCSARVLFTKTISGASSGCQPGLQVNEIDFYSEHASQPAGGGSQVLVSKWDTGMRAELKLLETETSQERRLQQGGW